MNKKLVLPMLIVLGLGFVFALSYYAMFNLNVLVHQSIHVSGGGLVDIDCDVGETCIGNAITISNDGASDRTISVSVEDSSDDLTTGVAGELVMTHKSLDDWTWLDYAKVVRYSIIGEKFKAWDIPEGYKLVYYPNKDGYGDKYYTGEVVLEEDVSYDLPVGDDLNGGVSSDYCTNGFNQDALFCQGAKLWLVPDDAFLSENVIDWSRADEFYFETDLITYTVSTSGVTDILVPALGNVKVYPQVTVSEYALGDTYPITITVA